MIWSSSKYAPSSPDRIVHISNYPVCVLIVASCHNAMSGWKLNLYHACGPCKTGQSSSKVEEWDMILVWLRILSMQDQANFEEGKEWG